MKRIQSHKYLSKREIRRKIKERAPEVDIIFSELNHMGLKNLAVFVRNREATKQRGLEYYAEYKDGPGWSIKEVFDDPRILTESQLDQWISDISQRFAESS